jgi:hypothetical protein
MALTFDTNAAIRNLKSRFRHEQECLETFWD